MKILVMGAGGIGGFLGARLAASGADLQFVARGAHLHALQQHGLQIAGVEPMHVRQIRAADVIPRGYKADLVLFCVKLYDTTPAAQLVESAMGANTAALTLQNGIDHITTLSRILGAGRVLAGAAYFPANVTAPGEITYLGKIADKPHVAFGESAGGHSARAEAFAALMRSAGIEADVAPATGRLLWEKFLLIAGTSAATTIARCDIGTIRADPDLRWLLRACIAEAYDVAVAAGVELDTDVVDTTLRTIDGNPANGKSSQLVDLEKGKRLELEGLSGAVVRRGRELGVETPVHQTIYAALKPFVDGRVS